MFIDTPANTLRLARIDPNCLKMRLDYSRALYNCQSSTMLQEQYDEVQSFIKEHTDIFIPDAALKRILDLYPATRIRIAEDGGVGNTDIADLLMDDIAHFFLGCSWPIGKDNIDIDAFLKLLQHQASFFKFA